MDHHQRLANGLYTPLLPERYWDNEVILKPMAGYTSLDAFKILNYVWSQYLDEVESVLFCTVDLCDEVEIDFATEGSQLLQLFGQCPVQPMLKREQCQQTDQVLHDVRKWADHIDRVYTDLTKTIGQSVRCEKEHPQEPPNAEDRNCATQLISIGEYGGPKNSWLPLRLLIEVDRLRFDWANDAELLKGAQADAGLGDTSDWGPPSQLSGLTALVEKLGIMHDTTPTDSLESAIAMNKIRLGS